MEWLKLLLMHCLWSHALGSKCQNARPTQKIDWNKMKGTWYQIANDGSLASLLNPCATRTVLSASNGHFTSTMTGFLRNGRILKLKTHNRKTKGGYYLEYFNSASCSNVALEQLLVKAGMAVLNKNGEVSTGKFAYYTDYKNYFLGLHCNTKGQKKFWYYSRNPTATAKDIVRVHNKLAQIGHGWSKIHMYLTPCQKFC